MTYGEFCQKYRHLPCDQCKLCTMKNVHMKKEEESRILREYEQFKAT